MASLEALPNDFTHDLPGLSEGKMFKSILFLSDNPGVHGDYHGLLVQRNLML